MTRQELLQHMKRTFEECLKLCAAKNADYAHSDDAWGNLGLVEHLFPGVQVAARGAEDGPDKQVLINQISKEQGTIIRLADKLQRLAGATYKPLEVKDETVDDTCRDTIIYAAIAKAMFDERKQQRTIPTGAPLRRHIRHNREVVEPGTGPMRIHIIGPYTGDGTEAARGENTLRAMDIQRRLTEMGHYAYCPHTHTHHLHAVHADNPDIDEHQYWIKHGLNFIELMDDAIFEVLSDKWESDGTNSERALAKALGLPIYTNIDDVPPARPPEEEAADGTA